MRSALALLLFAFPSIIAAKRPVTLDDVLARHESAAINPIWAPDGQSFAYEKRSIVYRYKLGDREPSRWFDEAALRGQTEAEAAVPFDWQNRHVAKNNLQWLPNSHDLLVLANANLYTVHPGGKSEHVAVQGPVQDPEVSPDGKKILYRKEHNLYVFDFASQQTRQLTADGTSTLLNGELDWVYPEELELSTAVWWSPDSTKIAFMQFNVAQEFVYPQADLLKERAVPEPERYPQAGTPNATVRLGTVEAEGGNITWMQLPAGPDTLLARVAWLPDSTRVAVEIAPRIQNSLDLLFCDTKTGSAKPILHEQSKTWINITDNLTFLSDKPEFLWTSERTGFRHIYRYSLNGEILGQVTSGDWEVKTISAVDEKSQTIYYTSSESSPLETQLYSVPFAGGKRTRITAAGFDHKIGMDSNSKNFVDEASNLTTPPETVVRNASGASLKVLVERDLTAQRDFELSQPEIVQVSAEDGTLLYGRLIKPLNFKAEHKYPVIVQVYGGPHAQSVRNDWGGVSVAQLWAAKGYVVWELDNRGSAGRGHAFEEIVYHNLGHVEVTDQRTGVQYLVKAGIADPNRIGVTGWSYGGYMTLRCLLTASSTFKAGAAGAPVTDWHNYDTIYTERYMGLPSSNQSGYQQSSNVLAADKLEGKLLIQHNLEDDNVLFQNTMQLINAFDRYDRPYALQLYGQKTHGVTGVERRLLDQTITDFFDRNL